METFHPVALCVSTGTLYYVLQKKSVSQVFLFKLSMLHMSVLKL